MNPFDYVNNINTSRDDIWDANSESEYNVFFINKALSFHLDWIYHAQQMNRDIPPRMHYDYMRNVLPKKKRSSGKWEKEVLDKEIELIQEAYKCSYTHAAQYRNILNNNGISRIKEFLYQGGKA
jgi:hypothetical protein